jgi:signal transduction histidine kinase
VTSTDYPPAALRGVAQFGEFILSNQEKITTRWITLIDRSPATPASDDLTYGQIRDHLPMLCSELGAILKRPNAPALHEQAARDASAHGQKRWQQGYQIEGLIRELCLIRTDVLETWLVAFLGQNPSVGDKVTLPVSRLVNQFFDDVIVDSTVQFAQEQNETLRGIRTELTASARAAEEAKSDFLRHVSHALREPLGAMAFAAQALSLERTLSREAMENVRIILRNLELETNNVNELMLASQLRWRGAGPKDSKASA